MYKPLPLCIGLRYLRAKKQNHFISFMSWISVIGIMIGVAVLVTVLSVMNGFDEQIRNRLLVMVPQVSVTAWGGKFAHWSSMRQQLLKQQDIQAAAPFVDAQGMLSKGGQTAFVLLKGIDPTLENTVSPIGSKLTAGEFSSLKAGQYNMVLGQTLAENLGVSVGDSLTLVVPKTSLTPLGTMPRLRQFHVTGIFKVGYQFDSSYVLINIKDAQTLEDLGDKVSGLQLKLSDVFLAPAVVKRLSAELPYPYHAFDWTAQNPNFFKALQMEKTMMFLILALIVAVAAFNMLSSLVMLVTDKQADIAILRTIGMQTGSIMRIFMVQGICTGLIGIAVGVGAGIFLSDHVTQIAKLLEQVFRIQLINANVYYIDFLPSKVLWSDIGHVVVVAVILSVLATLYPAYRASRIQPAEALRYE